MAFYPQFNNLTDQQLKAASWWLVNKRKVLLMIFIVLIIITVLLWTWLVFSIVNFFSKIQKDITLNQQQVLQRANFSVITPKALITETPVYFYNTNNTLDLAVKVINPNLDWEVIKLKFNFSLNQDTIPGQEIYLGPGQTTMLVVLRLPWNKSLPSQAEVSLEPSWRKITEVVDGVSVSDINIQQNPLVAQVSWLAQNQTLRNYWQVPFVVASYSYGQLVGVNEVSIEKLKINEQRPAAVSWFGDMPQLDQAEVFPQIDPYDSANWWIGE